MESLDSSVKQVHNQTSTNKAVAALSVAVSNLTTKQETAIMHNQIEHMFGEIMGTRHSLPYSLSHVCVPPEHQLIPHNSMTDTYVLGDDMLDDGSDHHTKSPYSSKDERTTSNSVGPGNHTNSRLELAPK
jgi:hypothetical protein